MQRRVYRRRFSGGFRRRRAKYMWVRSTENVVAPQPLSTIDLLGVWKQQMGITLNLPTLTIWRILLKISIRFDFTSIGANDGAMIALFVDDLEDVLTANPVVSPYDEKYLMWDQLYATEQFFMAGSTPTLNEPVLYKQYDIRSHRKLPNLDDTLVLQIAATGLITIKDFSFTQSTLVRLP